MCQDILRALKFPRHQINFNSKNNPLESVQWEPQNHFGDIATTILKHSIDSRSLSKRVRGCICLCLVFIKYKTTTQF